MEGKVAEGRVVMEGREEILILIGERSTLGEGWREATTSKRGRERKGRSGR